MSRENVKKDDLKEFKLSSDLMSLCVQLGDTILKLNNDIITLERQNLELRKELFELRNK